MSGEVSLDQGLIIVLQAKMLLDSINKRINLDQSSDIMQRIVKFMDFRYKNSMASQFPENNLLKDINSFFAILYRYFEERLN